MEFFSPRRQIFISLCSGKNNLFEFFSKSNKIKTGIGLNRPDLQPECKTNYFCYQETKLNFAQWNIFRQDKFSSVFVREKIKILKFFFHVNSDVK